MLCGNILVRHTQEEITALMNDLSTIDARMTLAFDLSVANP